MRSRMNQTVPVHSLRYSKVRSRRKNEGIASKMSAFKDLQNTLLTKGLLCTNVKIKVCALYDCVKSLGMPLPY